MATVKENLIAAKALIDTPEKWGKGIEAYFVPPHCPKCALEAVRQAAGIIDGFSARRALGKALPASWESVSDFNDSADTDHPDIMALFDRAIAAQDA